MPIMIESRLFSEPENSRKESPDLSQIIFEERLSRAKDEAESNNDSLKLSEMSKQLESKKLLAAIALAENLSGTKIKALVENLGDNSFFTRQKAHEELEKLGAKALPELIKAAESPDLEVTSRVGRLLDILFRGAAESLPKHSFAGLDYAKAGNHLPFKTENCKETEQFLDWLERLRDARSIEKSNQLPELRLLAQVAQKHKNRYAEEGADILKRVEALEKLQDHQKELAKITRLNLESTQLDDENLKELVHLKNLQSLNCANTRINDSNLAQIEGLKDLRKLNLKLTSISDSGLTSLAKLPKLEALDLQSNYALTGKNLSLLKDSPIKTLNLSSSGLEDFEGLKELKQLKELQLVYTKTKDRDLQQIAMLKNLEILSLESTKISGEGLVYLKDAKNLKVLNLSNLSSLRDENLAQLKDLKLTELQLNWSNLSDRGATQLRNLEKIEKLGMSGSEISKKGLEEISLLPELKELSLRSCPKASDDWLLVIAKMKKLELLDLGYTNITGKHLDELAKIKSLKVLHLPNSADNEKALDNLSKALPHLQIEYDNEQD